MSENLRAADSIIAELAARIMSGQLADGQPLPTERELINEFGASRTVVREAISTLGSRGLVESKPRFRSIVRKPNYQSLLHATDAIARHLLDDSGGVKNLYESRIFIERGLVRDAAANATREDIARLKAALAANQATIADSEAFFQTDIAFHGVFYGLTGNPIFPAIHQAYTAWLSPQWEKMQRSPERNAHNYQAHQAIYEAVLERDPVAADEALTAHLKDAWQHVSLTFDAESV